MSHGIHTNPYLHVLNKMGVSFMKTPTKVCNFLLSLEEHSVYYSDENQLLSDCFCLATQFYHTNTQMSISLINYFLEEM